MLCEGYCSRRSRPFPKASARVPVRSCARLHSGKRIIFEYQGRTVSEANTHSAVSSKALDFSEVKGQDQVKRAIEVAAAGHHHILLVGPVGAGKSVLAKRIPSIIPPLEGEETEIRRPFRSPHHTASDAAMFGEPANPDTGEVGMVRAGVLFLDDLPEFRRSTLATLSQQIADGKADFTLAAGMEPCPCGYFGVQGRECRCSPGQVEKFHSRIPASLLALIDIQVEAPAVNFRELSSSVPAEPSAAIRERVADAWRRQRSRFSSGEEPRFNVRMAPSHIDQHCALDLDGQAMLRDALENLHPAAIAPILRIARTIADLAGAQNIQPEHIGEAVRYRALDRKLCG